MAEFQGFIRAHGACQWQGQGVDLGSAAMLLLRTVLVMLAPGKLMWFRLHEYKPRR